MPRTPGDWCPRTTPSRSCAAGQATGRDVADPSARTTRRLEVAVEVVERQQLDLDRLGAGGLVREGGAGGGQSGGGDQRGQRHRAGGGRGQGGVRRFASYRLLDS